MSDKVELSSAEPNALSGGEEDRKMAGEEPLFEDLKEAVNELSNVASVSPEAATEEDLETVEVAVQEGRKLLETLADILNELRARELALSAMEENSNSILQPATDSTIVVPEQTAE